MMIKRSKAKQSNLKLQLICLHVHQYHHHCKKLPLTKRLNKMGIQYYFSGAVITATWTMPMETKTARISSNMKPQGFQEEWALHALLLAQFARNKGARENPAKLSLILGTSCHTGNSSSLEQTWMGSCWRESVTVQKQWLIYFRRKNCNAKNGLG